MAKKKRKTVSQLVGKLCDCLDRCSCLLTTISRPKATRDPDPCAAEQAVYDAAVAIAGELLEATAIAVQIATAAGMALMQCRTPTP